ncbi:homoserine kinase [Endothiovibrio diazotrophicus]
MSVYTAVERDELEAFLADYTLGELDDYQGISAGIENTNFFVTTTRGRYVLTLFEQLLPREIPFFLELTHFLSEGGIPAANPQRNRSGRFLSTLNGKPAALVERLSGASVEAPNEAQCAAIGEGLARLHVVGAEFARNRHRVNDRGPRWWKVTAERVMPQIPAEEAELIREEMRFQADHHFPELPRSIIHADLFRDNALFEGDTLSGIIDFYYACNSLLLYDLAVLVNDWCIAADGTLDPGRLRALLQAYHGIRPLSAVERQAWPVMLRAAALRFWLSRLQDACFPRPGEMTHIKDPGAFRDILRDRIAQREWLLAEWV